MSGLDETGDPNLDALFAQALDAKKNKQIEIVAELLSEDLGVVSQEPPKVTPGTVENSGFKPSEGDKSVAIPVMSEEELSNNEPSFGKPMRRVKAPKGVGVNTFYTLLSNAYALYVTEGSYDNERLQRRTGLAPGIIARCASAPEFKAALRLRGVSPEASGLTREQELVLQALSDPSDGKTLQQKLKSVGVTYATYRGWLQNVTFRNYLNSVTEAMTSHNADALVQLEKLVGQGDLSAIKYKLEMNGRYRPGQQQSVDLMALMSKILEIISKHVQSPEALSNIAADLGEVANEVKISPSREIGA